MFWPFLEIDGELSYCPLADFGAQDQREGKDIYAKAVVAQPLTGHLALRNAELVKGKVVVMERGACDFVTKVLHAQAAGAVAVIVANTRSEEDPSAAFVMDAGSRQSDAESIRIPAVMLAHGKAAAVFERIRASYLDHQEFALTIKFLGARAAAQVMEQIEQSANEKERSEREEQRRLETEQQQVEAAKQLRSRLSENRSSPATCSIASTPSSASRAPSSVADGSRKGSRSAKSCFEAPQGREFCVERNCDDTSSAESGDSSSRASSCSGGSLYVDTRDSSRGVRAAEVTNHWCPMTTALLIMDVQNYFALHQNEKCLVPHASVNLAYYKRINSVMVPTIQDVLLACRASEGVEVVYSVVESATRDGRDRSRAHKHAGIHIAKSGFGAKVLPRIAPMENDIVIPRTGVKCVCSFGCGRSGRS